VKDPHLISVDELRAAGALDVPAAWRKSLGGKSDQRDLFPLFGDDDMLPEKQQAADEPDDAAGADEGP